MTRTDRAVFDTNILISAYLWPGTPRAALAIIRSGQCRLFSSPDAIREFVRVLAYPKLGLRAEEITPIVDDLTSLATIVQPGREISVIRADPTDNVFLSIALEAGCEVMVSGDRHLLELKGVEGVRIVRAAAFVRSFQSAK